MPRPKWGDSLDFCTWLRLAPYCGLLGLLTVLFAACANEPTPTQEPTAPAVTPATAAGAITEATPAPAMVSANPLTPTQPAPTYTPLPTYTPYPTPTQPPTPVPTATPTPEPAATPTPEPAATPTPAPTPVPAATPTPAPDLYTSREYGYSIEVAPSFELLVDTDDRVSFETSQGEAFVDILVWHNENNLSLSENGEDAQALLEETAREQAWIVFEVAVSEEVRAAGVDYYELSYEFHRSQEYCPTQSTDRLYLSQAPSYEPFVLMVSMGYCQESADPYGREALAMLDSFRPSGQVAAGTPAAEMSAAEVYAAVSPSAPFIETPTGTGSGVLIGRGYVVTNYHVVWPYEYVWVVFPDGSEFQAPVVGWDPMTDIAVLGPVDAAAEPLRLESGEGLSPGTELFLVGYPAEVEDFPKPTITRGILSRLREWEQAELTYVQTDADIAGGQSGGALVNSRGGVIGISGFSFSEAQFGLAASSADISYIIDDLIGGRSPYGLGDRRHPTGRGVFSFDVQLDNPWDTRAFALNATAGTGLLVELDGTGDGAVRVSGPTGQRLFVDDSSMGVEQGGIELSVDGVYFVQAEMASGDSGSFELSSNIRLQPFHDPDDGVAIEVGQVVAASLDHARDVDWFSMRLNEGETVAILADSVLVDTLVVVDFPGSRDDQVVLDDNSGGGSIGESNSWLVYRAPKSGEYWIAVVEANWRSRMGGGYFLSVKPAPTGSETVHVPR